MDAYTCSGSEVPSQLYRVDYPGSQTVFSSTEGFSASDTTKVYNTNELDDFRQAIVNQFTWGSRASSPFISLFSDREHAENWGRKEPWRGFRDRSDDWFLHLINTTRMKDTSRFFKLSDLFENLGLDLPDGARQHIKGAFLCLHRIPIEAMVQKRTSEQVKAGKFLFTICRS